MTRPGLRRLPRAQAHWELGTDVVVVGSGAAGMTAALTAAQRAGGCCCSARTTSAGDRHRWPRAAWPRRSAPMMTRAWHRQDTLSAGPAFATPSSVAALTAEAPGEITRLAARGARLNRTALHREGGHGRNRIVHAGGDAASAEIHRVLLSALLASPVEILTRCVALDALLDARGVVGGLLAGMVGDDGALWTGTCDGARGRAGDGWLRPGLRDDHQPGRGDR